MTALAEDGNESVPASANGTTTSAQDTENLVVSLTAPSHNAEVSGVVTVSATASDNVGVMGVQFKMNGSDLGPEDTTNDCEATWDPTGLAPDTYSLSATARDAAGNTGTAQAISVTIGTGEREPSKITNIQADSPYTYEVSSQGLAPPEI